jgi:hypothetical protein
MEVGIEVERATEALHEGHRSCQAVADAEGAAALSLPGEDAAKEDPEDAAEEGSIDRQSETQRPRHCQHPLAVGRFGQLIIDEGGGDVGHAPRHAARTEAAFAAEGDEAFEAALWTAQACEAASEQTTVEVTPELVLEEDGIPIAVPSARLFEEGLQVVTDDGVEDGLLGLAPAVAQSERRARCARRALVVNPGWRCIRAAARLDHVRRARSERMPARCLPRFATQSRGIAGTRAGRARIPSADASSTLFNVRVNDVGVNGIGTG